MNAVIHVSRISRKPYVHKTFNDRKIAGLYDYRMGIDEEISRRLAEARNARGMTLKDVCALVPGLQVTTLHSYERGARSMPIGLAKKLSPIYRVSAAFLLTISDDKTEDALLDMYRHADERGKATIRRVAESESPSKDADDLAA